MDRHRIEGNELDNQKIKSSAVHSARVTICVTMRPNTENNERVDMKIFSATSK
jgi:hypothetical protein